MLEPSPAENNNASVLHPGATRRGRATERGGLSMRAARSVLFVLVAAAWVAGGAATSPAAGAASDASAAAVPQATPDYVNAPPSFALDTGVEAVFVDFESATYELTFYRPEEEARVVSTIDFYQPSAGHVVFDLVPDTIRAATLDGEAVDVRTVETPDGETRVRIVGTASAAGDHRLVVRSSFDRNIRTRDDGVVAGLWVNDWADRAFLETYLPSNFEYDAYQMTFDVAVEGTSRRHRVYANGEVSEVDADGRPVADGDGRHFRAVFPAYYNASHLLFQIAPYGYYDERNYVFDSAFRPFPVTIYGASIRDSTVAAVNDTLTVLEAALGPWPHEALLVSMTGPRRSMEYAGATQTTLGALAHELAHSYHGRSVAPASGNASWFDEAVVTWLIDRGAPTLPRPPRRTAPIGGESPWFRATNQSSYSQGSDLIGHLDHLFRQRDPDNTMLACLREMAQERKHEKLSTGAVQEALEACYGDSLQALFDRHVYAR